MTLLAVRDWIVSAASPRQRNTACTLRIVLSLKPVLAAITGLLSPNTVCKCTHKARRSSATVLACFISVAVRVAVPSGNIRLGRIVTSSAVTLEKSSVSSLLIAN